MPCLHLNHQAASHCTAARQGDAHSDILHCHSPWLCKLSLPADGRCRLCCSKEGPARTGADISSFFLTRSTSSRKKACLRPSLSWQNILPEYRSTDRAWVLIQVVAMRLPAEALQPQLGPILEGVLLWAADSKNKFKLKVRRLVMQPTSLFCV